MMFLGLGLSLTAPQPASSSGGFNPSTYGTVLADHDAAHVTESAGTVDAMLDQGPNGWDASSSGASRPAYTSEDANYNGLPTVNFEGSEFLDTSADIGAAIGTAPFTVAIVGHCTDPEIAGPYFLLVEGASANAGLKANTTNDNWEILGALAAGPAGSATSPAVVVAVINGASSKLFINSTTGTEVSASAHDVNGKLRLGGHTSGSGIFSATGPIARSVVFAGAMSDENAAALATALGTLYGVAIT